MEMKLSVFSLIVIYSIRENAVSVRESGFGETASSKKGSMELTHFRLKRFT